MEEQQLLRKALCSYLPYKLKCKVIDSQPTIEEYEIAELHAVYSDGSCVFHDLVESDQGFANVKPLLLPLSELTNHAAKVWRYVGAKHEPLHYLLKDIKDSRIEMHIYQELIEEHFNVFNLPEHLWINKKEHE